VAASFEQQVMAALHRLEQEIAAIKRMVEETKRGLR
jgi:DNA-binding FrmR family transcriptional regulator